MGSGSFIKVLLKNFDVLAGPIVTLVYPLYASVQAIETKSPVDDQQWLTYWVLYSLMTLIELTFAKVIEWLPFWPFAKLIFSCWLVLPYFSGAAYVYQHFVRPMFVNQQTVNIWYVPKKKGIFSRPDDVLVAAEKFIEENGPDAFQKLIRKAEKDPKPKKPSKRVSFMDAISEKTQKLKPTKNNNKASNTKVTKTSNGSNILNDNKATNTKVTKTNNGSSILNEPEPASGINNSKRTILDEPEVARIINPTDHMVNEETPIASVINSTSHAIFGEPQISRESAPWTNSGYMIFNDEYIY